MANVIQVVVDGTVKVLEHANAQNTALWNDKVKSESALTALRIQNADLQARVNGGVPAAAAILYTPPPPVVIPYNQEAIQAAPPPPVAPVPPPAGLAVPPLGDADVDAILAQLGSEDGHDWDLQFPLN